jgi:predicted helicase
MASPLVQRLQSIRTFPSLIKYLRDELDWPIESDDFDDLTFDYEPEELGIDSKTAVKIKEIKQLRPLDAHQPWGIFFVNFEPKRLPIVVLRRVLRSLVVKKRSMAAIAHRATWQLHDLLFISSYGEYEHRELTFAHFNEPPDRSYGDLPTLKVLGWDSEDTVLRLDHVVQTLSNKLKWPDEGIDNEGWCASWSDAFVLRPREVIRTSRELAVKLADLAKSMRKRANEILKYESETGPLRKLHKAFQTALIHELTEDDFADMYAQTIAYGLLASSVSRPMGIIADNLKDMVPITNPFLKEIMGTFLTAGGRKGEIDFDELGIQEIVDLLNSPDTHMEEVLRDFGNRTMQEDPVIHFYELFLREYDREKKVRRGVFYTPQPVVSYIVRSVHELLQTDFGLEDGLASTATWEEMAEHHNNLQIPEGVTPEQPFVQILDPATGTATFLVQVIETIHNTMVEKWKSQGKKRLEIENLWNEYVPRHLLPRMYGYELMMAPYAIAHMKIGLKLAETGYDFGSDERVNIYLTNALEPAAAVDPQFNLLAELAPALAQEAKAVSEIKRNRRFTVVIGNPPYSRDSSNRNAFAESLVEIYKTEVRNERNIQPLSDDYVKFMGLSHSLIAASGFGFVGLITNHSFIRGLIHRGLRAQICFFFNKSYFFDLHGNSNIHEEPPVGVQDKNVFDIQQGVAVSILARTFHSNQHLREVRVAELWGPSAAKYDLLLRQRLSDTPWTSVELHLPDYCLIVRGDGAAQDEFDSLLHLQDWFPISATGFITHRDELVIDIDKSALLRRVEELADTSSEDVDLVRKYGLKDNRDWQLGVARRQLRTLRDLRMKIVRCTYRPFDSRWCWWGRELMDFPRPELFSFFAEPNITILCKRQNKKTPFSYVFVTSEITESCAFESAHANNVAFPIFAPTNDLLTANRGRLPNVGDKVANYLKKRLELRLVQDKTGDLRTTCGPGDLLHYIYAVLHATGYRERYEQCLIKSFPRLPLPDDLVLLRDLARLGSELVALHLMESLKLNDFITTYSGPREPGVKKVGWSQETVWLDAAASKKGQPAKPGTEGFRGVPEDVWNFHIGGYQVCHKWLKDRKGRTLSEDDINHYQKIVVALKETIRIMGQIDEVIEEHGGWPGAFVGKC